MIGKLLKKIVGSKNDRELKRMGKLVARINAFEEELQALDDVALRARSDNFRKRLAEGETLDDLLPEAFAVCREASVRSLGMRHFDVQLIGGITLLFLDSAELALFMLAVLPIIIILAVIFGKKLRTYSS